MAVKFVCDICGTELFAENTISTSNHHQIDKLIYTSGALVFDINININGKQGGNDVCLRCFKERLLKTVGLCK